MLLVLSNKRIHCNVYLQHILARACVCAHMCVWGKRASEGVRVFNIRANSSREKMGLYTCVYSKYVKYVFDTYTEIHKHTRAPRFFF